MRRHAGTADDRLVAGVARPRDELRHQRRTAMSRHDLYVSFYPVALKGRPSGCHLVAIVRRAHQHRHLVTHVLLLFASGTGNCRYEWILTATNRSMRTRCPSDAASLATRVSTPLHRPVSAPRRARPPFACRASAARAARPGASCPGSADAASSPSIGSPVRGAIG